MFSHLMHCCVCCSLLVLLGNPKKQLFMVNELQNENVLEVNDQSKLRLFFSAKFIDKC